jgi:type II secretory pathway component PulF
MLFSPELPLPSLIEMCRALRHNLGAGLGAHQVFRQLAASGSRPLRSVARRILGGVEQGDSLATCLERDKEHFPPLLVALAGVGEETGQLPEVFGELEKYYLLQLRLRRQFRSQSMLPVIQFVLAVLIIAGMLFVIGLINQSRPGPPTFGIRGPGAAGIFLIWVIGTVVLLIFGYHVLTSSLKRKAAVDAFLLRVPVVGPCLEALAMSRFAMALQLTLDSSLSIRKALRLSLRATGNEAYACHADAVASALRSGENLTTVLTRTRIFSPDFLHMIAVGEEGGRVPEIMRQQMGHYNEEAERRLRALARAASMGMWLIYAGLMVVAIFRIASMYLGAMGAAK